MASLAAAPVLALAPGDPRRPALGRSVGLSFAAAALFVVSCLLTKDIRALSAVAPWAEDPYDAFVSFAMFFVAGIIAVNGVRTWLCRRADPLPIARVVGIVRGFRVIGVVSLATIAACWASVLLRPPGPPSSPLVPAMVLVLAANTVVTTAGILALRASQRAVHPRPGLADGPDLLADTMLVAGQFADRLGGARNPTRRLLDRFDERVVPGIRRHRLRAAAAAAGAFGLAVGVAATFEGDSFLLVSLMAAIGAGGMLVFLVVVGSYLDLVRPAGPPTARPRLLLPALAAAVSLPITVAFRDGLWWVVGSSPDTAGISELALLLTICAGATFVVSLFVASVRRPGSAS